MAKTYSNIIPAEHRFTRKTRKLSPEVSSTPSVSATEKKAKADTTAQIVNLEDWKWRRRFPTALECLRQIVVERQRESQLKKRHFVENVKLHDIQQKVEEYLELKEDALLSSDSQAKIIAAKQLFSMVAKKQYEFTYIEIARYLQVSPSQISKLASTNSNQENLEQQIKAICETISTKHCNPT